MSDQYLWDKSGAPDAETERLERSLGSLRFQPSEKSKTQILDATRNALHADVSLATQPTVAPVHTPRRFATAFAIAAMLLLAIVAGSLWIKMSAPQSIKTNEPQLAATTILPPDRAPHNRSDYPAVNSSAKATATQSYSPKHAQSVAPPHKKQSIAAFEHGSMPAPNRVANSLRSGKDNDALIVEGERAKEQLVRALYIASEKLNFAQKKIQANKDNVPAS